MSRPGSFDYDLFGLRVRSAIALPELAPARSAAAPDVVITLGLSSPVTTKQGIHPDEGGATLHIDDVGTFIVRAGSQIDVHPRDGVDPRNIRLFLLGSAFGIILHQRGMLPLHANAIEIDGRAIAFMGESGSGKSTLAAWFHDRGHRILADDVCVIGARAPDGHFPAHFGVQRLRLWQDALEASGRQSKDYGRSYADLEWNKFDVPILSDGSRTPLPLAAIYRLSRGEDIRIERLTGVDAIDAIFANTYRGFLVETLGDGETHFRAVADLVAAIPLFRFTRPWNLADRDRAGEALIAQLGCLPDARIG